MTLADYYGLLPELVLLLGATVILLALPKARTGGHAAGIALISIVLAGLMLLGSLGLPLFSFMPADQVVLGLYQVDAFATVLKLIFLVGTGIVVMASPKYMGRSQMQAEYYALLITATVGMMVVASSRDLLTLFLGVEVASFSSYILAGSFKNEETSSEASTKYFITGALSSTLTLYGISLLYGATGGVITFDGLSEFFAGTVAQAAQVVEADPSRYGALQGVPALALFIFQPILAIAVFMIIAGLGFKITMAPFHMWAPDTYEGAPDTVAAFLGGVGKGLGVVALFKVFLVALAPLETGWEPFIAVLAIVTMTWGNLVAIKQDDIKRMLAYSSIAQAGYILIVLPVGTEYAIAGGVFHTLTNLLMKGGAFLVVAAFASAGFGTTLQDYRGLGRKNPLLAIALSIFLLSLAGLPPLGGFWSKFVLFSSAVDPSVTGGASWLLWLAVAGALNSAISLYYYARWIRTMFTDTAIHPVKAHVPTTLALGIGISVIGIVGVGLWAEPVLDWSIQAAQALLAAGP